MASLTPQDEGSRLDAAPLWPEGSVRALLETGLVREPTRAALLGRLNTPVVEQPTFLTHDAFLMLRAVLARLIPQPDRGDAAIDVAGAIDAKLGQGKGNGWRYASMPPDGEAYRRGLHGIDETARAMFGELFGCLHPTCQDAVLAAIQAGSPPGATWASMPAPRFFEELLVMAVEAYYAHPLAQEEIGYVGMADAQGWTRIGLGEREAHEPGPVAPLLSSPPLSGAEAAE